MPIQGARQGQGGVRIDNRGKKRGDGIRAGGGGLGQAHGARDELGVAAIKRQPGRNRASAMLLTEPPGGPTGPYHWAGPPGPGNTLFQSNEWGPWG